MSASPGVLPDSGAAAVQLSPAHAYHLLYGKAPTPEVQELLRQRTANTPISTLGEARRMLMALDRQTYPSPAIIRFDAADVEYMPLDGFTLAVDQADLAVSNILRATGAFEPALTAVFRRVVKPGWRVADIGANIGYHTALTRSLVGDAGHVSSFEPNSENARLLLLTLEANGYRNVTLYPVALSDQTGYALFTSAIGSNGILLPTHRDRLADGSSIVVPTMRLDDLVHTPLDFIKIDTEGSEARIMRGARRILSTYRPVVATEFSATMISAVSGVHPRDYLGLYGSYGYQAYRVAESGRLEGPIDDVDAFLAAWTDPGRIDDLLMLPAGMPAPQP